MSEITRMRARRGHCPATSLSISFRLWQYFLIWHRGSRQNRRSETVSIHGPHGEPKMLNPFGQYCSSVLMVFFELGTFPKSNVTKIGHISPSYQMYGIPNSYQTRCLLQAPEAYAQLPQPHQAIMNSGSKRFH